MQATNITITSLGGSGENGRNCFLINTGDGYLLLDCGVKREIVDGQVGIYPAFTPEIVANIKAVFLSHCHEDHTAALPYLYELGYRGAVYATAPTIAMTPGMIDKWMKYVATKEGQLPFSDQSVQLIRYEELMLGHNTVQGIPVELGRSGHVIGGVWLIFEVGGKRILYTGDTTLDPVLLERDEPTNCDAAIMNCAYAGKHINQKKQYEYLLASIKETLEQGGKVLLPLPTAGRASDIYLYLAQQLEGAKMFVEQSILDGCNKLLTQQSWVEASFAQMPAAAALVIAVQDDNQRQAAADFEGPAVYLAPDGMLTSPESLYYYARFKTNASAKVIITGHAAAGTVGAGVLDQSYRLENQVQLAAEKVVFKVHLDDDDALILCKSLGVSKVLLFHAMAYDCTNLINRLGRYAIEAVCLQYPDVLSIK